MKSNRIELLWIFIMGLSVIITIFVIIQKREIKPQYYIRIPEHIDNWKSLLQGGHHLGKADAPVKIIEFSDFQCPYCKQLEPNLRAVLKKFSSEVEFVYYDFPLPMHPQAFPAAIAAECSMHEGKFFKYHDLLYQKQLSFDKRLWDEIAKQAGIKNLKKFNQCLNDSSIHTLITKEKKQGLNIGIHATPTLIINGEMITGVVSKNQLDVLVQQELDKLIN
jgi:protein-disulfide isomerase